MASMAFDGEAPETDDEIEEVKEEKVVVKPKEMVKKLVGSISIYDNCADFREVSIDKNLKKRWTQVAIETITSCQKRSVNQEKTMQKVVDLAADSFTCMQVCLLSERVF